MGQRLELPGGSVCFHLYNREGQRLASAVGPEDLFPIKLHFYRFDSFIGVYLMCSQSAHRVRAPTQFDRRASDAVAHQGHRRARHLHRLLQFLSHPPPGTFWHRLAFFHGRLAHVLCNSLSHAVTLSLSALFDSAPFEAAPSCTDECVRVSPRVGPLFLSVCFVLSAVLVFLHLLSDLALFYLLVY